MRQIVLLLFLGFLTSTLLAQPSENDDILRSKIDTSVFQKDTIRLDTFSTSWYKNYVKKFLLMEESCQSTDSAMADDLEYLYQIYKSDTLRNAFATVMRWVDNNTFYKQAKVLQNIEDSLALQRILCDDDNNRQLMRWKRDSVQWMDSIKQFYAADTLLAELIDMDSVISQISIFERPTFVNAYRNDTLDFAIQALRHSIFYDSVYQWIINARHDTIDFYIVGVENDSLQVRLYDGNSQIIYFNINDYWGGKVPAMLRDISHNSMKILVDDVPDVKKYSQRKAKSLILKEYNKKKAHLKFTLQPREVPDNTPPWIYGGFSAFQLSQVHIDSLWPKGGLSSWSFRLEQELFANYKFKNGAFENKFIYRFGMVKQGEEEFKANEDRIELISKTGYKAFGKFFYSALVNFKTQSTKVKDYPDGEDQPYTIVSRFFSPASLTIALGLDYKPNKKTSFLLSPLTSKNSFVLSSKVDETRHGHEKGERVRSETGAILRIENKHTFKGDIEVENRLELFASYLEKAGTIDVDWQLKVNFPVNDYITANIFTHIIYDDDIAGRPLIQERLALGVRYKF